MGSGSSIHATPASAHASAKRFARARSQTGASSTTVTRQPWFASTPIFILSPTAFAVSTTWRMSFSSSKSWTLSLIARNPSSYRASASSMRASGSLTSPVEA